MRLEPSEFEYVGKGKAPAKRHKAEDESPGASAGAASSMGWSGWSLGWSLIVIVALWAGLWDLTWRGAGVRRPAGS